MRSNFLKKVIIAGQERSSISDTEIGMILNNTTNSLVDAYYIFYLEWYSRINNKKFKKKEN